MLAICNKHRLDVAETLSCFANDLPRTPLESRRNTREFLWYRVSQFAEELRTNPAVIPAVEKFPRLLPYPVSLGLRLAAKNGLLTQFYGDWLTRPLYYGGDQNSARPRIIGRLVVMFLLTIIVFFLVVFIGFRSFIELQQIAEEFEVEFGHDWKPIWEWVTLVCFGLLSITLATMLIFAIWDRHHFARRWNPFAWQLLPNPNRTANRQSLALSYLFGKRGLDSAKSPVSASAQTLIPSSESSSLDSTAEDLNSERMTERKIISVQEQQAVGMAASPGVKAWLLQQTTEKRWLATIKRLHLVRSSWTLIVYLVLCSVVFTVALMTITFMTRVIWSLDGGL